MSIQSTASFTPMLGNALMVIKTRPRFLGGHYSSRITEKAKPKFLAGVVVGGTTADRKSVEDDCKHVFQ